MKVGIVLSIVIPAIIVIAILVGLYFLYVVKFRTKRATPNQALLVTGRDLGDPDNDTTVVKNDKGNYVKIVRGGVIRLKFMQFAEKINLNSFQLHISVKDIMVQGKDLVDAEATVQISVGDTNEHVLNYAEQFLGKDDKQIQSEIEEILTTHFRAILTTLTVDEINSNRESFNTKVSDIAKNDLDGLGFKISGFGLGKVEDSDREGGYLSNAERQRKAIMKKNAEVVESEAERETRIQRAENEKLAKEIENERSIEIAESDKIKELKEAEIRKQTDKAKAESEMVYELEKATQNKKIVAENNEVEKIRSEGDRKIAMIKAEETKEVALKRAEQSFMEEQKRQEQLKVEADSTAEIDKIKANAQAEVNIRKAQAEAESELEIAKAEASKRKLETEVEAEKLNKIGLAEAASILAKGTSEAKSQELLADAKMRAGELHLKELAIKTAPLIAKELANAIGAIDSVKIFQTGGNESENISSGMTSSLMGNIGATYDMIKETTGIDLSELALNNSKKGHIIVNNPVKEVEKNSNDVYEEVNTGIDDTVEYDLDNKTVVSNNEKIVNNNEDEDFDAMDDSDKLM